MTASASAIARSPSPELHRMLHAAVQMMLEQLPRQRVERRLHGARLA